MESVAVQLITFEYPSLIYGQKRTSLLPTVVIKTRVAKKTKNKMLEQF